jgi:transposase
MWTSTTRRQDRRDGLRDETDLTDAEWALIEPLLSKPHARGRPAPLARPGDPERDLLCPARRHCLAPPAFRLAAQEHGLLLVQPVV